MSLREIIKQFNLDNEYGKYDEPGKFWRISNLILKNLQENITSDELKLTCEYDLDTVKEEKRVINADEVEREHFKALPPHTPLVGNLLHGKVDQKMTRTQLWLFKVIFHQTVQNMRAH